MALKRVGIKTWKTYDAAKKWQKQTLEATHEVKPAKVKVFARYDGTYDVVTYITPETPGQKVIVALTEAVEAQTAEKVHGLKSKERKRVPKKK